MQHTADRGGSFGQARNWMHASPPGIAFRFPRAESSPVARGEQRPVSRKRALKWVAAACLALGIALTGDALYIHAKAVVAQALLHRAWLATHDSGDPAKPWPLD